ncbi:MAG TPA: redoxin domain-containing protein [Acidimicrobiales bacterium]
MRRRYLGALGALLAISALAVMVAGRADPANVGAPVDVDDLPVIANSVPGPDQADGWIDSDPLTGASLEGKVVVYDFWTYSCVNCVRTLPHLAAWYERYQRDGLVIVGVHSPEFDFEKDRDNVERAVGDLGVTWPVALDPDHKVWDAFGNRYWPAKYVVDREGRLRYTHYGEGAYDETEDVLRELLGVDPDAPRAADEDEPDVPDLGQLSPEIYVGGARGTTASPQGLSDPDGDGVPGGDGTFTLPDTLPLDTFALDGAWSIGSESATALAPGAAIVLHYRGQEVNLVLAAGGSTPASVTVSVDGGEPRTVDVGAPDLVNLLRDGPAGDHTMRIEAGGAGLAAYAFTFG